eukprot:EG_transcript_27059
MTAAASPTRGAVLRLYRSLLKAGEQFADYNFRMYTLRVVKEDFRSNRGVTDPERVAHLYRFGREQLAMVKRQATINQMFATSPVVLDPKPAPIHREEDDDED